jgi:hypothetical protein
VHAIGEGLLCTKALMQCQYQKELQVKFLLFQSIMAVEFGLQKASKTQLLPSTVLKVLCHRERRIALEKSLENQVQNAIT